MTLPSETHVLQSRHTRPAFGGGSRKLQSNYPQYLLQGGLSRADFVVCGCTKRFTTETSGSCFGEVVGDNMLVEFHMPTTHENRARLALRLSNDEEKKSQASRYVAHLKDEYGYGYSTLCLVYNATGDTLGHQAFHNGYGGSLYKRGYPEEIGNGQWAAFLHVYKIGNEPRSLGAVVYRGKNKLGQDQDFLLAWNTTWSLRLQNKAYCEIISPVVESYDDRWDDIRTKMEKSSYTSKSSADGFEVDAHTDPGTSPTFTAIIKQRLPDK